MAAKFLILFACLALSGAALVKREAPGILEDIQKHAADFQKTFVEQMQTITSSENTQQVNKAFQDGSNAVLQQLGAFSSSLQAALGDATGKAKEALEQTKANIERTAAELRQAHPEVEQQATALRDKLQAAVQSAAQETQKLAKEVASNVEQTNQKLAPQIQAAYNDFVKQAEAVQKKLHEAATTKQ